MTPLWLESLRSSDAGDYRDVRAPGLRLRVLPSGRKVWRWSYWEGKAPARTQHTLTLGEWPSLSLGAARDRLEALRLAHRAGRLQEALADLRAPPSGRTVKAVAEDWYTSVKGTRRAPEQVRRTLDRDILPAIGPRPISGVTAADCRVIVRAVVERDAPSHAGKVLDHLRQLFSFAMGYGEPVPVNPAAQLDKGALGVRTARRQRTLSEDEIPAFWRALELGGLSPPVLLSLRLLLLVPLRTCELLLARWSEVDLVAATWTVPVAHQKLNPRQVPDAKPWTVPLSPAAVALLRELSREASGSPWVAASASRSGHLTDKALSHALRALFRRKVLTIPPCTPHDLRRTVRTGLGKLGIAPHVAERCLNHSLGRIVETYDQGTYLPERRAALDRWAAYVERCLDPAAAKVVPIR